MQLAYILSHRFSDNTRQRGYNYYRQRRVLISSGSPSHIDATVRGTEGNYLVLIHWTNGKLAILCDCPYFTGEDRLCKHLWGTILAADEKGYLAETAASKSIELDVDSQLKDVAEAIALDLDLPEIQPARLLQPQSSRQTPRLPPPPKPAAPPAWKTQLTGIFATPARYAATQSSFPADAEILYILDISRSLASGIPTIALEYRQPKKNGDWKSAKSLALQRSQIHSLPLAEDRELISLLAGGARDQGYSYLDAYDQLSSAYQVQPTLANILIPRLARTGRCILPHERDQIEFKSLSWDEGQPWKFALRVEKRPKDGLRLSGEFRRETEGGSQQRMELSTPFLASQGGFLFGPETIAPLDADADFPWISNLRKHKSIAVPSEDANEFLAQLLSSPFLPALDLPEELQFEEVALNPRPCLKIFKPKQQYGPERMHAELTFDYGGHAIPETFAPQGIFEPATRRYLRRDLAQEKAASTLLYELGLRVVSLVWQPEIVWNLPPKKLPHIVHTLVQAGWQIVAEGKAFHAPGATRAAVSSGLDWFELEGEVDYGGTTAQLPQLLQALKRGETMVQLDDGSYGLLPEEWLRQFGLVAGMGEAAGERIRFSRSQAGLLDALLAAQPAVDCDPIFQNVRRQLERFQQVLPAEQPAGFRGQLRHYQLEGLGWMHFLRQFSFGGCLADDMGVGKTAQVLALLETRRELRSQGQLDAPSLAVVPKSLIFNWKQEVERFAPQLRVLDFTGLDRHGSEFSGYDLILTTYGTLRRDALRFKDTVFDYIVLDEAQAIKNANTESAKAVRLLRGNHRLALSGTPIENHLGELWSLFEFLNPGLLGASSTFQLTTGTSGSTTGEDARKLLAHALRPFLLRRTKEQVATELPAKIEQTLYCELDSQQRALYNDLRQHYRDALLNKIGKDGIAKSKIMVLEALLRLRQAACHPGLIDKKHIGRPSAKLDVLLDRLREVLSEGHKALVFSQFTSLLAILTSHLDKSATVYEYLDGSTADRQARVERFQSDPDCQLFLISLKAGGVGLNLTAADYVFILDPWWNPAVEAQAVDRAHRIGQTRQVFSYRLIAKDTVEEKVLELQATKRDLADAILSADNSLIRNLRAEDIELLLS